MITPHLQEQYKAIISQLEALLRLKNNFWLKSKQHFQMYRSSFPLQIVNWSRKCVSKSQYHWEVGSNCNNKRPFKVKKQLSAQVWWVFRTYQQDAAINTTLKTVRTEWRWKYSESMYGYHSNTNIKSTCSRVVPYMLYVRKTQCTSNERKTDRCRWVTNTPADEPLTLFQHTDKASNERIVPG